MNRSTIIAFIGISGVGKTTFLQEIKKEISFTHIKRVN